MARVVSQRTSPPYLLIAFVILFILSAGLAVLFYTKFSDVQEQNAKIERINEALASPAQLKKQRLVKMVDRFRKPRPGESRQTVVGQLSTEIDKLAEIILGAPTEEPRLAMIRAEDLYRKLGTSRGLVDEVEELLAGRETAKQTEQRLQGELTAKDDKLIELNAKLQQIGDDHAAQVKGLQGQVNEKDREIAAARKKYQSDLSDLEKQFNEKIASKNEQITALDGQRVDLKLAVDEKDARIAWLEKENRRLRGGGRPGELEAELVMRPDGKVMKVLSEAGLCYINVGRKDGVREDMSFAVYNPAGLARQEESKANILVTDAKDDISACRIVTRKPETDLAPGDEVSNLAFERVRPLRFLVVGEFDLYGTGRATSDDAKAVQRLIRQFGGKITEVLDPVETDIVVMGVEPSQPTKPRDDATPEEGELYRQRTKLYLYYQDVKRRAGEMKIPVLKLTRFLALTGYVVEETLR